MGTGPTQGSRRWILALILIVAGCGYARIEGALVDEQPAQSYGGVTVWRGGSRIDASYGMSLRKEDIIETDGRTALVIRFQGGNEILMEPRTKIRLGSVWTFFGKVVAKVKDVFAVETDYGAAGTSSTLYIVEANESGLFEVTVLEGRVDVTLKRDQGQPVRSIHAGQQFARRVVEGSVQIGTNPIEGVRELDEWTRRRFETALRAVVPELYGKPEAAARELLMKQNLGVQVEYRHTGEYAPFTVISQSPEPGSTVKRGAAVHLTVEKASNVPGLVGLTYKQAQRAVRDAGLSLGEPRRVTGANPGYIVRQSLSRGASVAPGTKRQAITMLQKHGLRHSINWRGPKGGDAVVIVDQNPAAGSMVLPGDLVTLTVEARIN
jgi:hypothetical protein